MSVFDQIKSILQPYGYPIEADEYGGGADRYFVVMVDTTPVSFLDNAPKKERYNIMVHYVAPKSDDISSNVDAIKRALKAAGFTWPSVISAGDSTKWREILEFQTSRAV